MFLQNLQADIAEAILSGDHHIDLVTPPENLLIHENNFYASLTHALSSIYPCIIKLVGEECFRTIANEYIRRYPSRTGNLNDYGSYLSDFFLEFSPLANLPYLSEVAAFEWAYHAVLLAPEHTGMNLDYLKMLNDADYHHLHLALHPASQLMQFQYPLLKILALCHGEANDNINLDDGGVQLLLIRRDNKVEYLNISPGEFAFLNALRDGLPITDALSNALTVDADFNLENHLPQWVADKTVVESENTFQRLELQRV